MGKVKRKSVARTKSAKVVSKPIPKTEQNESPPAKAGPLTAEKKRRFLEAYSQGRSVKAAAEIAGTSHVSVFKAARLDPEFGKEYKLAMETNVDMVEDRLLQIAMGETQGNFGAVCAILNGRRPATWRQNMKVEHSGQVSSHVTPELLREARERVQQANSETKH